MINRYIELRSEGPDVIAGTVLRYGDVAHIGRTFHERFMPGSVQFDDVVLNLLHDRQQPVARTGAGLELRDSQESLALRATIPDTVFGRRAKELVDAKIIRGLSAEFVANRERMDGGVRVIQKAELVGVALVDRPAYPASTLDKRSAYFAGGIRMRAGLITGLILYEIAGLVSMIRKRKMLIERGALTLADSVYLLPGFDYNDSLASTAAGSLNVKFTPRGVEFETRRLLQTLALRETRRRIRGGLITGVVPGIAIEESTETQDKDGFTVERVKKGMLCEINLTARKGLAEKPLRRRWLY